MSHFLAPYQRAGVLIYNPITPSPTISPVFSSKTIIALARVAARRQKLFYTCEGMLVARVTRDHYPS